MKHIGTLLFAVVLATIVMVGYRHSTTEAAQKPASPKAGQIPRFEVDPMWPKTLPNAWAFGNIGGMAVDAKDHVWVANRPSSVPEEDMFAALDPPSAECCRPAPPVLEFDQAGNLVQFWGPIHGVTHFDKNVKLIFPHPWAGDPAVKWPSQEHGIYVDTHDNVWVANQGAPSQVVKFTRDGKFLMQVGSNTGAKSSNDTTSMAGTAGIAIDPKTDELFVADGYSNRRVIVFDGNTGAYKRHWGAYGKKPPDGPQGMTTLEGKYNPDGPLSQHFATVHCVEISKDRLLYVCDRANNRIQVFQLDGTFVKEGRVAPWTTAAARPGADMGAVHDIGFSQDPAQTFMYVADGANKKVWIVRRDDLKVVGSFGQGGYNAGQFAIAHALAVDSKGNVYVGESRGGSRIQKFKFMGYAAAPAS